MKHDELISQPSPPPVVSVVIPARDEARSLGTLIDRIKQILSRYDHEIIVVDDGSKDETRRIAAEKGALVISHGQNVGKGAAMKTGAEKAEGSIIVFIDADGAHDPEDILKVIAPILEGEADLVIGSRALPGSRVSAASLRRRLTNTLASLTISAIVSFILPLRSLFRCPLRYIRITDCTSGFRAIKREKWGKLHLISQGFQIETEMIYEAAYHRLAIKDVPIRCTWDSKVSHLSILRDGWKTLKLLMRKLLNDPRSK